MIIRNSKRNRFRKKVKPINQEEFVKDVLDALQGAHKGDKEFAQQFVIDMVKIFPKAFEHKALFLRAVKGLSRHNSLTVDNAWEYIRHSKDPYVDKVITTIPMGGKN